MDIFDLKHFAGDSPKHHLSLVSHGPHWSLEGNADLPFAIDEPVFGSSCKGLVYFAGKKGKIVVCNLKSREWIVFLLPYHLAPVSERELVVLEACGLGYDPNSGDYKLFKSIIKHIRKEEREREVVFYRYHKSKVYNELYSFTSSSWKKMDKATTPEFAIMYHCAEYVGGSCYWTTILESDFLGLEDVSEDDRFHHHILAFDIASESFSHLPFPRTPITVRPNAHLKVVEYCGSLGALIYEGHDHDV